MILNAFAYPRWRSSRSNLGIVLASHNPPEVSRESQVTTSQDTSPFAPPKTLNRVFDVRWSLSARRPTRYTSPTRPHDSNSRTRVAFSLGLSRSRTRRSRGSGTWSRGRCICRPPSSSAQRLLSFVDCLTVVGLCWLLESESQESRFLSHFWRVAGSDSFFKKSQLSNSCNLALNSHNLTNISGKFTQNFTQPTPWFGTGKRVDSRSCDSF